jgi:tryptophan synthase alpha chain
VSQLGSARLAEAFARAAAERRAALIPYLCAGDPDPVTSARLIEAVAACGADILEIGIPYGDPLADGPTIAAAAQRALHAGMNVAGALELAKRAGAAGGPPVVMFTYVNPIVQFGIERFATALVEAGVCGAIVPDLPVEEMDELRAAFEPRGLALPLLIAPSTPPERALTLATRSQGFIYVVSRLGVTGARREPDLAWIAERVASLRAHGARAIAVGFGIANAAQVRAVAALADGVVVGSALIDAYAGTDGDEAVARVRTLLHELDEARLAVAPL